MSNTARERAPRNGPWSPQGDCAGKRRGRGERAPERLMKTVLRAHSTGPPWCHQSRPDPQRSAGQMPEDAAEKEAAAVGGSSAAEEALEKDESAEKGGGARQRHGPEMPTAMASGGPLIPVNQGHNGPGDRGRPCALRPRERGRRVGERPARSGAAGTGPWRLVPHAIPRLPPWHQHHKAAR